MRRVIWLLAVAGLLLASSLALRGRGAAYEGGLTGLAALSVLGILAGARYNRTRDHRPWAAAAGAALLFALAHAAVLAQTLAERISAFPAIEDVLRLSAYPFLGVCLLFFVRRRTPARDWGAILDAAVVAIGVASVMWVLVLRSIAADPELTLGAKATAAAFPVAGIALLGLVVRLVLTTGSSVIANCLVGFATVLLLAGDGLYAYGRLEGWYERGSALDIVRSAVPLLLAVAALDPSMRGLTEPVERPESWPIRRRVLLLLAAVATTAAMVVVETVRSDRGLSGVTVTAAVALLLVVSGRLANVVVAFDRSIAREHVLQAGAAALVSVRAHDDIKAVAIETAGSLAGGKRQAFVQVELGANPTLSVKDAVVVGGGAVAGAVRGEIRRAGSLGRLGTAKTFIVPIVSRDRLQGVIRVTGIRPLPWHLHQGLDTLASQVALALESAKRRDDIAERRSDDRFRSLVQNSRDVIAVLEPDLTIRFVTPSVTSMLGHAPEDLVGTRLDALFDSSDETAAGALHEEALPTDDGTRELRLRHADGRLRTVECVFADLLEDPSVRGIVLTAHDVSDRRVLEDKLTHQAFHDALTGLPNRALLTDRIDHALERSQRTGGDVALLFLDLDDFKTINDSLGHAAGDDLLVEIASRLRESLRSADTAARLGGDEFALLLEDADGVNGASIVAERLLMALSHPITLGSTEVQARASIGIVFGEPGQQAGELLRNADVAMYRAKEAGGHRFQLFEPKMHEAALTRLGLKADLERAFACDELDLHYQPLIDLANERIVAFEALLRWNHPVRGFVPPIEFIPLAEETGLINDIGEWVIHRACRQIRVWQTTLPGQAHLAINVNLSARQILRTTFRHSVVQALAETGLHPSQLVLEITESTLMEDVEGVSIQLAELREMGIRLAIDDFGTGFSSLSYLQRFPVDELKIAREFVDDVVRDPRRARLVEAVVALARSLELVTVAEGIEEDDQRRRLLELGCAVGQGYLFSRPLPAAEVPGLLQIRTAA